MQMIENIHLASLADTLVSLTAALILGGLAGLERQYRQRIAGLRTNVPMAVGAAIFVNLANHCCSLIVSGLTQRNRSWPPCRCWP